MSNCAVVSSTKSASKTASTQPTMGESATPAADQTNRSHSTPLQDARVMLLPLANTVPPARPGIPQVLYNEHINNSNHPSTGYKGNNYNNGGNFNNTKNDYTEKTSYVKVTLKGSINKEKLFKIQQILRSPRVYRDKLPKGQQPAMGE